MEHLGRAGLWSDRRETSGSNANDRWRLRPDGVLEQSGEVTLSGGTATIMFPVAFPATCDFVGLTAVLNSTIATDSSVYQTAEAGPASVAIDGTTTTVGLSATIAAASFKVRWRAVGS